MVVGDEDGPLPKASSPEEELANLTKLVASDVDNAAAWKSLLTLLRRTNIGVFMNKVLDEFKCPVCHELCASPLTAPCKHSQVRSPLHSIVFFFYSRIAQCIECFRKARRSGVNSCPKCRLAFSELTMDEFKVNSELRKILRRLFPHIFASQT